MKNIKILLLVLIVVLFSGCAMDSLNLSKKSDEVWYKYIENNGTASQMAFMGKASKEEPKNGEVIGMVIVKKDGSKQRVKIGDMYFLNGQSFLVIDLDRGAYYINMHDKNDVLSLKDSKNIKFYEIGNRIIETIVYSSKTPVCKSFQAGKAVNAKSVTNYYTNDNFTDFEFFITTTNAKVVKNKNTKLQNIDFKFFISDQNLQSAKDQVKSQEFREKVINKDLAKQERILRNIVCPLFAK